MPPTFSSSLAQSTSPAFALLESLISSITSLAQLLESTYFATHSSFFALAGVADQFGAAKMYLGQVLGVFSVLRWGKGLLAFLKGGGRKRIDHGRGGGGAMSDWGGEFASLGQALTSNSRSANAAAAAAATAGGGGGGGRPSAKPLIFFLLTAIGLPFAMSRLINLLSARLPPPPPPPHLHSSSIGGGVGNPQASPLPPPTADLTFARASFKFEPKDEMELALAVSTLR